jgi:plasmid maintenance system antidote protein VapI
MYNFVGDKLKELLEADNRSIQDLGAQTWMHPARWSQLINGSMRLSVDMAIRLGKVFPGEAHEEAEEEVYPAYPTASWLWLQHASDLLNAEVQNGIMYRDMKPFEKKEIAPPEEVLTE